MQKILETQPLNSPSQNQCHFQGLLRCHWALEMPLGFCRSMFVHEKMRTKMVSTGEFLVMVCPVGTFFFS